MKSFVEKQEIARTLGASQKWEAPKEDERDEEVGGVIILPPVIGDTSEEIDSYPADYVEYCIQREREYKRTHGDLPRYTTNQTNTPPESEDTDE